MRDDTMVSELDHPFWSSLCSRHRNLAQCAGNAARPPEFAPFLGVAHAHASVEAIDALMTHGEAVYLLGVVPALPERWKRIRRWRR